MRLFSRIQFKKIKLLALIIFLSSIIIGTSIGAQELAKEQVLVIGLTTGDIGTIDPHGGLTVQDRFIAPHLFGSLVRHQLVKVILWISCPILLSNGKFQKIN